MFNKTICYDEKKEYRDWHCDLNCGIHNSFGLGIFNKGNTPVKVHFSDWGCEVSDDERGKCRVFAFTMI